MKIVVLDGYTLNPGDLSWESLAALGDLSVYDRTAPEDVLSRMAGAEIVFTNKALMTRDLMTACPNLRYIGVLATGYNVVDIAAAQELGITVTNIPGYSTPSVAQMTLALLLEITNSVGLHHQAVQQGEWCNCPDFCFTKAPQMELAGKICGIIGYGTIGKAFAHLAAALGMEILALGSNPADTSPVEGGRRATLQEILAQSDMISLHCPLTDATAGLINADTIAQMKPGVILLNTSRGPLLQEAAVADALRSGKLHALGVDVASVEPMQADNPLLTAPNCYITPHIAWATKEARQRLMDIAVENLRAFMAGAPVHVVN